MGTAPTTEPDGDGAAPDEPSVPVEEVEAFTDQARWLIESHTARSESVSTRAVALLGFTGVILALTARLDLPQNFDPHLGINIFFWVTVAALLATAICCLNTLATRTSLAPGVDQLRNNWRGRILGQRAGKTHVDIAETFLSARDKTQPSVVDTTKADADSRATWFRRAVWSMLAAVASLAILVVLTYNELF